MIRSVSAFRYRAIFHSRTMFVRVAEKVNVDVVPTHINGIIFIKKHVSCRLRACNRSGHKLQSQPCSSPSLSTRSSCFAKEVSGSWHLTRYLKGTRTSVVAGDRKNCCIVAFFLWPHKKFLSVYKCFTNTFLNATLPYVRLYLFRKTLRSPACYSSVSWMRHV